MERGEPNHSRRQLPSSKFQQMFLEGWPHITGEVANPYCLRTELDPVRIAILSGFELRKVTAEEDLGPDGPERWDAGAGSEALKLLRQPDPMAFGKVPCLDS